MTTERRRDTMRWLAARTPGLVPPLLWSTAARIVSQQLGIALLVVMGAAVVRAAGGDAPGAGGLVAVLVVLALLKAGLRYAEHYAGHWVAFTALQRLRELFFAALIPQAPAATRGRAGAALVGTATRDIDRIEVFFAHTFPPAVSAVAAPMIALTWLGIVVDARLALVLAPVALAMLVVPLAAAGTEWRGARTVAAQRGAVAAHLGDDIHGTREVLLLGAQQQRLDGLAAAGDRLTAARAASGAVQGARQAAIDVLQAGGLIAVVAAGAATGSGLEAIVLALAVAVGLRGPLRGIDSFMAGLDAALASAQRLRAIVDAPPAVVDRIVTRAGVSQPALDARAAADHGLGAEASGTGTDLGGPGTDLGVTDHDGTGRRGPGVRFDGVTLVYPAPEGTEESRRAGESPAGGAAHPVVRPALADASVALPAGEWSFVVGASGSGKSTLASLLVRAWDPGEGTVRIGGTAVDALPLAELRGRIALVDQRPTLLIDSLRENLRLARSDATDAHLWAALTTVGLADWAEALPQGLDTVLAAGRSEVSGGQLQRLALARALVAEPEVLILDEALSQLDEPTAQAVRAALLEEWPARTTIEVTHRVDRVPADAHVVVIDAGRVVQEGRSATLLAEEGSALARLADR